MNRTVLKTIYQELCDAAGNGDDGRFMWPRAWSIQDRAELNQLVCLWQGLDPQLNSILAKTAEFSYRAVMEYCYNMVDMELAAQAGQPALGIDKIDPEIASLEDSQSIVQLARVTAEMQHTPDLDGHGEFFDECDHKDCKLVNSFEFDLQGVNE